MANKSLITYKVKYCAKRTKGDDYFVVINRQNPNGLYDTAFISAWKEFKVGDELTFTPDQDDKIKWT